MSFFDDQRAAKSKTRRLFFLFIGMVVTVAFSTGFVVSAGLLYAETNKSDLQGFSPFNVFFLEEYQTLLVFITLIVIFIIFCISIFKIIILKSNPKSICYSLGAVPVKGTTKDSNLKQYRNIVEEMSLASGTPMPAIFFLEDSAINAFACGYDINNAAICITSGCAEKLNRDELQAVVAHEFSHILNGDMTINIKLVGMIAGLIFIFQSGRFLTGGRRRSSSRDNPLANIGIGLMIVGGVGWLCGLVLKASISRQREYLADASSVQFTRNPLGITGALKKIYANANKGEIESSSAEGINHMFLVEGGPSFLNLSTHPDIFDRIKAVDKSFNVKRFLKHEAADLVKELNKEISKKGKKTKKDKTHKKNTMEESKEKLKHLLPMFQFLQKLPIGQQNPGDAIVAMIENKIDDIKQMKYTEKLKFLELISGTLKGFTKKQNKLINKKIIKSIKMDGKIDFDEFLIYAYLKPSLVNVKTPMTETSRFAFNAYANKLLSYVFYIGKNKESVVKETKKIMPFKLIPKNELGYSVLLKTIEKLRFSKINQKKKLIEAIIFIIEADGVVNEKEEVILKLLTQSLGVPSVALLKTKVN